MTLKHEQYKNIENRINSFETWPRGLTQRGDEMAAAGFFYT